MKRMYTQYALMNVVVIAVLLLSTASAQTTAKFSADSAARSSGSTADNPAPSRTAAHTEFVIGADDILAINVWKEPELSREVPVRSDGKISLPLLGDVEAGGRTTKQLQDELTRRLQEYISSPAVTVMVQQMRSRTFNILGEVAKPGAYRLEKPTSVLDGIALAGGLREWAKLTKIYVLRRRPDGAAERISFDYKKAIRGSEANSDFELQSRDTIVVP